MRRLTGIGAAGRSPRTGADLTDLLGQLATALARARELPGKVSDAQLLKHRLVVRRAELDRRIEQIEREMVESSRAGRDFIARRLQTELFGTAEQSEDTTAMLEEVDRVLQRLGRERRSLLHRLRCVDPLVAAVPPGAAQARVRSIIEEARDHLRSTRIGRSAGATASTNVDA